MIVEVMAAGGAAALVVVVVWALRSVVLRLWCLVLPRAWVGDTVAIGAFSGVVEHVGWATLQLRASSGDLVCLPNSWVQRQVVVRKAAPRGSQGVEMVLPVPAGVDPGQARRAAQHALSLSPYLALDQAVAVALEEGTDGRLLVRLKGGIFDARLRTDLETSVIETYRACLAAGAGG